MSDQGYGGSGQGGNPDWNKPNNGDQPGQYGGQYGNGQYGGDQYGDPQYPGAQPQYGQPGYGQPQYGQPDYGQPGYGQPGFGQPGGAGSGGGNGQKGIFIGLGAVVVAGLVVLVLAVTGVFSGSDDTTTADDSPKAAVEKVLLASKNQNLDDVKSAVCKRDLADPELSEIVGSEDHATSYTIGTVDQQSDSRAVVDIEVTTPKRTDDDSKLVVIKEDGSWKACFSESVSPTPTDPSTSDPTDVSPGPVTSPTPTPSFPSSSSSSSSSNLGAYCASSSNAAFTARLFVSFIVLKQGDSAAGCVYQGRVSTSQISAVIGNGQVYSNAVSSSDTGPVFTFPSVQGDSALRVTVAKQSDGKFYVTAMSVS